TAAALPVGGECGAPAPELLGGGGERVLLAADGLPQRVGLLVEDGELLLVQRGQANGVLRVLELLPGRREGLLGVGEGGPARGLLRGTEAGLGLGAGLPGSADGVLGPCAPGRGGVDVLRGGVLRGAWCGGGVLGGAAHGARRAGLELRGEAARHP